MIKINIAHKYNGISWIRKGTNELNVFKTVEKVLDENKIFNNIMYDEHPIYIECWYKDSSSYYITFLKDSRTFVLQRENDRIVCRTLGNLLSLLEDRLNDELEEADSNTWTNRKPSFRTKRNFR